MTHKLCLITALIYQLSFKQHIYDRATVAWTMYEFCRRFS